LKGKNQGEERTKRKEGLDSRTKCCPRIHIELLPTTTWPFLLSHTLVFERKTLVLSLIFGFLIPGRVVLVDLDVFLMLFLFLFLLSKGGWGGVG